MTSTYFEGLCEKIPKAKFEHSRDKRPDCRQVIIALIITPDGFPIPRIHSNSLKVVEEAEK